MISKDHGGGWVCHPDTDFCHPQWQERKEITSQARWKQGQRRHSKHRKSLLQTGKGSKDSEFWQSEMIRYEMLALFVIFGLVLSATRCRLTVLVMKALIKFRPS
jgi:thiol:disulfide interchange protein